MINFVFYFIIGVGVGYLIYLFYKKRSLLLQEKIENIKLSVTKPKRFRGFSQITKRFQGLTFKSIPEKILSLKEKIKSCEKGLKIGHAWQKLNLKDRRILMNFFSKVSRSKDYFQRIKQRLSWRQLKLVFTILKNKTKVRLLKPEDKAIKKRLQKHKSSLIKPEAYLGELLKRIPAKKKKKTASPQEETRRQIQKKQTITEEKKPQEKWETMPLKDLSLKREGTAVSSIEISEESIKKIENKLISEILKDPKNIEAYKKLGKLYYNQLKYDYAKESFEAAIKLGSGDKKIKELLQECNKNLGEKQR